MTGSTAASVSFAESSALLHELAGAEVSAKQVERAAEALGAEMAADERRCVEKTGAVAPTMYLGMDGAGVPMRATEVAGRAGKQTDGSAKTREAKVVAVWTAESRDAKDKPVRDLGSITYSAAIESAAVADTSPHRSDFAERVLRESTRRSFTQASRCVALGDGAAWIWSTARELLPQAIQILDRYHAKEALHRAAQSIFGANSEGKQWATARCAELDEGQLHAIVRDLGPHRCFRRGRQMCAVHLSQSRPHALPDISLPGFMYHRRPRGRMQSGDRNSPQTIWHALDRQRRQRHHRPALLQS
jgi:hypothetical protein